LTGSLTIYAALPKQDLLNGLPDGQPVGMIGVDFAAVNQRSMVQTGHVECHFEIGRYCWNASRTCAQYPTVSGRAVCIRRFRS
jgi:hypothetical protein